MTLRGIADLYLYPNALTVVRVSGAELREWLEHSARVFAQVTPGAAGPQSLLDPRVATYNFDVIHGLTWAIDLSRPPRTDADGRIVTPDGGRIVDLAFEGRPVAPDRPFLVVTNNYRADGGGRFPGLGSDKVAQRAPDTNRDVVMAWVAAQSAVDLAPTRPWRFAPLGRPTTVAFDSGPAARARLADVPGLVEIAATREGYARFAFEVG